LKCKTPLGSARGTLGSARGTLGSAQKLFVERSRDENTGVRSHPSAPLGVQISACLQTVRRAKPRREHRCTVPPLASARGALGSARGALGSARGALGFARGAITPVGRYKVAPHAKGNITRRPQTQEHLVHIGSVPNGTYLLQVNNIIQSIRIMR
jgi:hypothetical protein